MSEGNALRNEDFRKLLATPSAARSGDKSDSFFSRTRESTAGHKFTHKQAKGAEQKPAKKKSKYRPPVPKTKTETDELFDESEANLREVLNKYRDRAAERRKGEVDGQDIELRTKLSSGLHAFRDEDDPQTRDRDRREQEIRESKYLGGDIEHTHLVKGLDYSLLNKARSEIKPKDEVIEEEHDIETSFKNPVSKHALLNKLAQSRSTRAICKTLFEHAPPTKNEFFQKGRMAYVVELEEGVTQDDVPVTLLRSTFDCVNDKAEQYINANNMVINKLTEVLSYLRSDGKKKKKEVVKEVVAAPSKKENIFDDAKEYVPNRESKSSRSDRGRGTDKRERDYFDSGRSRDRDSRRSDKERDSRRIDERSDRNGRDERSDRNGREERREGNRRERRAGLDKKSDKVAEHNPFPQTSSVLGNLPPEEPKPKKSKLDQEDAYAELFPSSDMFYGGGDSDEEDFSKMDMGPKKGVVNRWDFETQEDYEKYQGNREAMPKAAFQFGVKAGAGRKTRKMNAQAEEKRLDKEFEKIEKIWESGNKTSTKY